MIQFRSLLRWSKEVRVTNEHSTTVKSKPQSPSDNKKYWAVGIESARNAFLSDDKDTQIAASDQLESLIDNRKQVQSGRLPPLISLYKEMLNWKLTGTFNIPFDKLSEAKIQIWELEDKCYDIVFFRLFIDHAIERFKDVRGFQMFKRVFDTAKVNSDPVFLQNDKNQDFQIVRREGATITIIGFSGVNYGFSGIGWNTFDRVVASEINANLIVVKDFHHRLYLSGVKSIGDYHESCVKIRKTLEEFSDTKVVALGGSAGVFGALNIACDLGLTHVVALAGPTSIEIGEASSSRQVYRNIAEDINNGAYPRPNLVEHIRNSAIKRIDFFVAGQHKFDFDQMSNIAEQCQGVVPHIYQGVNGHIVTDFAIEDRSLHNALCAEVD